jgi:hypothetical protein
MEITTLSRQFLPMDVIDEYQSIIWTERYYGDSEAQIVVPADTDILAKLPLGRFIKSSESDEVLMIETHDIKDSVATISCFSLLKWFNNRIIRTTAAHEDRYWNILDRAPGAILWDILRTMCVDGMYPLGVMDPARYTISNLTAPQIDTQGPNVSAAVPFGPVFDAMYSIATAHKIGMTLILWVATETAYDLQFRTYRGLDYTSGQSVNPVVRFSPEMDSLTDIAEVQSIANHKTEIYTFAPSNPGGLASAPGYAGPDIIYIPEEPPSYDEFDLRVGMVFADDITTETVGTDATALLNMLNQRAAESLVTYKFVKIVDGEIVPTSQFTYGIDYNLGDIIEVQGYSGVLQSARIIEYIRSQDSSGSKAYPSLEMID